jgi:hypothetical protein
MTTPPDLSAARAEVLALAAAASSSSEPLAVQTRFPMRSLPPDVATKVATRVATGLTPAGPDHPRAELRRRVALPSIGLAVLDAVALVAAAISGHVLLAVLAAVALAVLLLTAIGGFRVATQDPLRMTAHDQEAIAASARWQSRQAWSDASKAGPERGLVLLAAQTAERIGDSPAWPDARLDEQGIRLNLQAELDRADELAHRVAQRATRDADPDWTAALDRVAALRSYERALAAPEGPALAELRELASYLQARSG